MPVNFPVMSQDQWWMLAFFVFSWCRCGAKILRKKLRLQFRWFPSMWQVALVTRCFSPVPQQMEWIPTRLSVASGWQTNFFIGGRHFGILPTTVTSGWQTNLFYRRPTLWNLPVLANMANSSGDLMSCNGTQQITMELLRSHYFGKVRATWHSLHAGRTITVKCIPP